METGAGGSEAEQVGKLHEELAAVVEVSGWRAGEKSGGGIGGERGIQVLEVAVVADVERSSGVKQVSDEEVGVELAGSGKKGELLVGESRLILQDHAERQFAGELPVPLAADDVVVEDGAAGGPVFQTVEKIGVVDLKGRDGMKGDDEVSEVVPGE